MCKHVADVVIPFIFSASVCFSAELCSLFFTVFTIWGFFRHSLRYAGGLFLFEGGRMRGEERRISDCISDCSRDCAGACCRNWTKGCPLRSLPQNWDDLVRFIMKISILVLCEAPYRFF
ncbi:MAG TPA: hypothetical protein DEB43_00820 [Desulfovibrio sp.]|nr:hypothetical protein [Desulfovibrio sp.]